MTFVPPNPMPPRGAQRILMIAARILQRRSSAAPLPLVHPGQAFWCDVNDVQSLLTPGYASVAPSNYSPVPPPEPPYTVNGVPGLGAGSSNSSH